MMKILSAICRQVLGALITAMLLGSAASANQFSFGQIQATIPASKEFCPFDASHPFDQAWMEIQIKANEGSNEFVGAYALCEELTSIRNGESEAMTRWIIMLSPTQGHETATPIRGVPRDEFLTLMEQQFAAGVELDAADVSRLTTDAMRETIGDDSLPPINISSSNTPMLLGRTDEGVYAGLTMDVNMGQEEYKIAAVLGITMLKSYMLSINVYANFDEPNTINQLLVQAGRMVGATLAANSP